MDTKVHTLVGYILWENCICMLFYGVGAAGSGNRCSYCLMGARLVATSLCIYRSVKTNISKSLR